ncbi:DUF1361 domain-containing protein [Tumidithrix elongata RA019]|uniref:DUF1361 domain-containing protein n=1 Tax=Tumidithrix elongata BACA0141 TaxID=2716417 RepID=A0AAW9PZY1_9CYAN|nr:DUF1361 domain-containing protein [Tumidithrix elongata RA019]
MIASMIGEALEALDKHTDWIALNLFLAFIPLALSFWLFRRKTAQERSWLWWLGCLVFIAFLPNAPYLITDLVHLIRAIQDDYPVGVLMVVLIPIHFFAIISGLEAYVISLINLGDYLRRQGASKQFVIRTELFIHAICTIGVYLGRFLRFNSWDLVTKPKTLLIESFNSVTAKLPLVIMVVIFISIAVLYWIMKQVTLGVGLRIRQLCQEREQEKEQEKAQKRNEIDSI